MVYELVIRGARVMDPETKMDRVCNIGMKDGTIAQLAAGELEGEEVIEAEGLIASPGFIDIQAYDDYPERLSTDEDVTPFYTADAALSTGTTLIVTGNGGLSPAPPALYAYKLARSMMPVHCRFLIGNIGMRRFLGTADTEPVDFLQQDKMRRMLERGLEAGALGIIFGLQKAPGTTREEMTALGRIAAEQGKFAAVHLGEAEPQRALERLEEVLCAAEESGVALQLSSLPACIYGGDNLRRAAEMIAKCRVEVSCDAYPYHSWMGSIHTPLFDGGWETLPFPGETIEIVSGPMAGRHCTQPLFEKLRQAQEDTQVVCYHAIPPEDLEYAYSLPYTFAASGGRVVLEEGRFKCHPRAVSTPAKFLTDFVRDKQRMSLMEGLAKLTIMPAKRCGLQKKGRLQEGCDADIVLFSLERLQARATYGEDVCRKKPLGINKVFLQGRLAYSNWEDGRG
jgi:N-acyl-D-aspartate/D-glutamate deacylase